MQLNIYIFKIFRYYTCIFKEDNKALVLLIILKGMVQVIFPNILLPIYPTITVYKFIIERSSYNGTLSVEITCGNDVLSPSCKNCPKTNDTQNDEQWCAGNCRIDKNDGICKENSKFFIKIIRKS